MIAAKPHVLGHVPPVHGGRGALGPDVLDFSSNTGPLACPARVRAAVARAASRVGDYPDPRSGRLLSALAEYTGHPRSRIIAGNGAAELIHLFCAAFVSRGSGVLIPAPTFQEYESACALNGATPEFFESMDLAADLGGFASRIPRGGVVFLCNPNNPTGALLSRAQVRRIARAARERSSAVFVDECFIEMVPGPDESVIGDVRQSGNLVVLRSLTKSFGLAGVRIGYAVGPRDAVSALRGAQVPWSVSLLAQEAGVAALSETGHLEAARAAILRERRFLQRGIDGIDGLRCLASETAFLMVRTRRDPALLCRRLLGMGVLVRDCSGFRGLDGGYIRVAVRGRRHNRLLLSALEAAA